MAGMEKRVSTLEEFNAEAERFIMSLVLRERATFVTLSGELGAGKTAFVQAAARALGVAETVTSPTFVLEKIYKLGHPMSKFERLIHIDAYRLEGGKELAPLGFDELMKDGGNLILLEWPEKVADALPAPDHRISFTVESNGSRTISYG